MINVCQDPFSDRYNKLSPTSKNRRIYFLARLCHGNNFKAVARLDKQQLEHCAVSTIVLQTLSNQ